MATTVHNNQLYVNGVSAESLVKEFGSPLYVYDQALVRETIMKYKDSFQSSDVKTTIAYASKAFLPLYMVRLLQEYDVSIDCVSLGELYTVYKAGFDMSKVLFHGNNKSIEELQFAIEKGVGLIIVDNIMELQTLVDLAALSNTPVSTLLRVNPGIEAHTHEYIITAKHTSKFGESIYDSSRINDILRIYQSQELVQLNGFHCHIGSQVFELHSYRETIHVMAGFMSKLETTYNLTFDRLNIGGGFGIKYTDEDTPATIEDISKTIIQTVEEMILTKELHIKELIIEPGRSIISPAGMTLYTIGYTKQTYGDTNYLFVDGGMTDNIRPALYQAQYQADIATNMNGERTTTYRVAGKLCESGDVLIKNIQLPKANTGDILVMYATGAYTYSMASNYNKMVRPAVVFVENGTSYLAVKRQTLDHLLELEVI